MSATTTSRTPMAAARRRIVAAVNLLLAFAFLFALSPDAVAAQQPAELPQIRFVSSDQGAGINYIELCAGSAVAGCRAVLRPEGNVFLGPLLEAQGAQRLKVNDTGNLGGSATFLVFIQSYSSFAVTLEVTVQITGDAVSIVAPVSGRIEASGAMAPMNGLHVLQGQLFSIVPDVPAVIDLDLHKLWDVASRNTPYPQNIPGVRITVRAIG